MTLQIHVRRSKEVFDDSVKETAWGGNQGYGYHGGYSSYGGGYHGGYDCYGPGGYPGYQGGYDYTQDYGWTVWWRIWGLW